MARNNIQFKGIRHSPSDITGQDGDLLECVNLIHENGELKPIEMPERTSINMGSGYVLAAIHNVVGGKLFVGVSVSGGDTVVKAVSENGSPVQISSANSKTVTGETFAWSETIGNTLVIGTDKSTHYAIYKNNEYKWLGDKLPQPVFEFDFRRDGLSVDSDGNTYGGYYISEYAPNTPSLYHNGEAIDGGGIALNCTKDEDTHQELQPSPGGGENNPLVLDNDSEENRIIIRDSIRSRIEKALGLMKRGNVFVFPFFVRYAVRMFDNNYAMHSAPLLMLPSTLENPLLCLLGLSGVYNGSYDDTATTTIHPSIGYDVLRFCGMDMTLKCKGFVDESGQSVTVSDWSDIIKGVDIFLSSEVRSYDERGWDNPNMFPKEFYCYKHTEGGVAVETDYGNCYTRNKKLAWYDIFEKSRNIVNGLFDEDDTVSNIDNPGITFYRYFRIPLPSVNRERMMEQLKEVNLFYRVKQYNLGEIEEWDEDEERWFADEVEAGVLERLETLPILTDDYASRSRIAGKTSYEYNQRLILGNLYLEVPHWYNDAKTFGSNKYNVHICFKIEKPEKTIYVRWDKNDVGGSDFGHYLYYPDPDCKEAEIIAGAYGVIIPMETHKGINGSFALMPGLKSLYESVEDGDWEARPSGALPSESSDRYYQLSNTISMSGVANPFHFPSSNFKDVGRTKVIGIATNTLDVSYEQWGPYPLVVFCNDGIVTVTIDKEGRFTGDVDAISADVLLEPHGHSQPTLVQTGQTLMFLTQRGVMLMAGTKISCVSEAMNGKHFNPLTELSPANSVLYGVGAFSSLITETSDNTNFKTFAATGFLSYDYAHNRVLLMNVEKDYQYVFDLKTGLWSKQVSYTNLASIQVDDVPGPDVRSLPTLTVVPMKAAVNNYTEMYLQDTNGYLYKTMEVANENVQNSLYQYGYFISRPIRFGTDEYKTVTRMLNRHTRYAANSFVKTALYGSRDGVRYGRVNTLRGMSYQYYIFVAYTYLKPNERYSYLSVDFETRLTNKLR